VLEKKNNIGKRVLDIIKHINLLQKEIKEKKITDPCSKGDLEGMSKCKYNTRPIKLIFCGGNVLNVPFDDNTNQSTSFFRIEKVDGSCVTLRLLRDISNNGVINDSDNWLEASLETLVVDISCFCAIKCLDDIYLDLPECKQKIVMTAFTLTKDDEVIDHQIFKGGVNHFNAFDLQNSEVDPTYQMKIALRDLTCNYCLKLDDGVTVDNPNFIIDNVNLDDNICPTFLIIDFSLIGTEGEGNFSFNISNRCGLTETLSYSVEITSSYPS
jgi:hypothetical protein